VFIAAVVAIRLLFTGALPAQLPTFVTIVLWMITLTAGVMTARKPRQVLGIWILYVPLVFVAPFQIGSVTEAWLRGVW
jgi:hypothetical protein